MGPIPAKYFWPGFCIAWLLLSLGFAVGTIVAAQSDGGAEVVASYNMDEQERRAAIEQRRENRRLGWDVEVALPDGVRGREGSTIDVRVRDGDGELVGGLKGRVELYSPAKAGPVSSAELRPAPGKSGLYRAEIAVPREGVWDFRVEIGDGERHYEERVRKRL